MQKTNVTYASIKALKPCYDPIKYLSTDYEGTIISLLGVEGIPAKDRVWVAVREEFMTTDQLRKFALFCARQCEHFSKDPRVKACNDTTQAFLQGEATLEQVKEAAAYAAAYAAYAADAAAYAAYAADAAAYAAASATAASVAASAYAAYAAYADAAYADQVREEQCVYLIELLGK